MAGAGLTVISDHVDSIVGLTTTPASVSSIAGGSFVNGHRYIVIGSGTLSTDGDSTNSASVSLLLPDGTTDSLNQMQFRYENSNDSRAKSFGFFRYVVANGTNALSMQGSKAASSGTSEVAWPRLMAIDLDSVADDIFVPQDDWMEDSSTGLAQATDGTDQLVATLSSVDFGNDGGGKAAEDWLIFGCVTAYHDGVLGGSNLEATAKLFINQGSTDEVFIETGHTLSVNDNPREQYVTIPICVSLGATHGTEYTGFPIGSGSHDVKLKLNGTNTYMKIEGAQLFALRLNAFLFTTTPDAFPEEVETDLHTGSSNVTGLGIGYSSGTTYHGGASRANLPFRYFDTSAKQRLNFGLFVTEENSAGVDRGATFHVWENLGSGAAQHGQGPSASGRYVGDAATGTEFPMFWFHDEVVAEYLPGGTLGSMNSRISAENGTTGTGPVLHANFISFYTTLVNATVNRTPSLNMVIGEKKEISSFMSIMVGELIGEIADLDLAIAETRSEIASLNSVIAETFAFTPDLQVGVAATYTRTSELEVLTEGSIYQTLLLRIMIASENSLSTSVDVLKAATTELFTLMDLAVSDAAFISIEPDRPTYTPFLTVTDLRTS